MSQRYLSVPASWTASGSGSVVEHLLAKERVVGSNPIFRSNSPFSGVNWQVEHGPSERGPQP